MNPTIRLFYRFNTFLSAFYAKEKTDNTKETPFLPVTFTGRIGKHDQEVSVFTISHVSK